MNRRYKIRMYESGDGDGGIAAGIIVLTVDRIFSLDAASTVDAEHRIRQDVMDGKLSGGRVYEISPAIADSESIRTIAFYPTRPSSGSFLSLQKAYIPDCGACAT
jgi:hypothetical protein